MRFIQMGIIMLVYLFLFLIVYFVLSAPLTSMFDGFGAASGEHSDEMDTYLPYIRSALNVAFALIIVSPIVGFIVWVYHREPDWSMRRF